MADEQILLKIEVDNEQAVKDINKQNEAIERLQQENKELAAQGKKNSTQYQKNAASIQKLNSARKQNIKLVSSEKGSLNELRANLARLTTQRNAINTSTKKGQVEFRRLNKEINKQNTSIKAAEQAGGDFRRSVGNYQTALQGVAPSLSSAANGFLTMAKSAMAFIATPIGAVIAAIGVAVAALTQYFRDNEEGQNELLKITNYLSAAWGVFTDLLSDFGKMIFDAFKEPKKAISDLGTLILNNLINRWEGFVGMLSSGGDIVFAFFNKMAAEIKIALADVPIIGKAIDLNQAVKDSAQATKDIENSFTSFAKNTAKALTGIEDPMAIVNDLQKEFNENLKEAEQLSKTQIRLRNLEKTIALDTAKTEVEIAELRLKAKKEDEFTATERIAFLREAQRLTDEQFAREERLAQERVNAQREEMRLSNSTFEDKVKLNQLEAELERKRYARLNAQRKLETEIQTNIKKEQSEQRAQEQADAKAKEDEDKAELERLKNIEEEKTKKIKEEQAKRLAIEKQTKEARAKLINDLFNIAKQIAGKNEKVAKVIGITQAIINTATGITKAFATLPTPAAFPAAASIAATGGAQIGTIASAGASSSVSAPTTTTPATAPSTTPIDNSIAEQQALENAIANIGLSVSVTEINDVQNNVQVTQQTATI